MRLKTFHGPNMGDVMRQLRESFGEDAIIVSTEQDKNGTGVRVTAALDASEKVIALPNILNLRAPAPLDEVIGDALAAHGTPRRTADRLLHVMRDGGEACSALGHALGQVFGFEPLGEVAGPRPIALVGPPGAGKTVTIAKLAARAALADRPVKVITTDGFRAGGVDQLVAFTKLLEIKLHKALSMAELERRARPESPGELVLIDTAGIRRRGKVTRGIETYSVMRAQEALERADIGLLVVDASEGLTAQDLHIAGYITDAHKGLIVVPNKWDLVEDTEESRERFASRELRRFRFAPWAPLAFVSAKTGLNIDGLLDLALEVHETRGQRVPTPKLNTVIQKAVAAHRPPSKGQRALRILYVTQAEVNPPTFVFFVSDASLLHFSYKRYMEKAVRKAFGFEGTAIRLIFRSKSSE